jgi:glutamate/aspartate transport system substrate-binding protein
LLTFLLYFLEKLMKKQILALAISAVAASAAFAQAAAPAAPATSTIDKVKASGVVTMGVRESSGALSYTLGDGKFTGFHVEICSRILAELEKQVGKKVEVKYQSVTSQNRIPLVQNGTVDIECGSTTNNATRQKDVSFLNTTFVEEVRFAVKANSGINAIAQLNGKNVATTTGTTSVQTLRKNERATGVDFKEVFGKDHADSFLLLETGRADAFVMDGAILAGNIAASKTPADFKIVGEVLSVEPIAIMIRKDDPAFKKLGNDVIAGMVRSGDMAKLWDKWFMQPIPPKNSRVGLPVSESTKAAWASLNDKPMEDYAKK